VVADTGIIMVAGKKRLYLWTVRKCKRCDVSIENVVKDVRTRPVLCGLWIYPQADADPQIFNIRGYPGIFYAS
jgi:hypothetical protein